MNNDRELLKQAAKASGIDGIYTEYVCDGETRGVIFNKLVPWNPLEDDGDALRLAVKLKLLVVICGDYVETIWDGCMRVEYGGPIKLELGDDPYAATRRAIVRAAAEIGKGKK